MQGNGWRVATGLLVFMMAAGFLGPAWSADVKIAYVDIQKAVNESNAGKEAKKGNRQGIGEISETDRR